MPALLDGHVLLDFHVLLDSGPSDGPAVPSVILPSQVTVQDATRSVTVTSGTNSVTIES